MAIPSFNLRQRQQLRNDAKEQDLIERFEAHLGRMREGAERHEARMAQYDKGDLGEVMGYITQSLATPAQHREWKKIIDHGKTMGFNGLTRDPMYREFRDEADGHLRALGSDFDGFRQNINDALRPENMSHFLGERISSTDPNPRETLHNLVSRHIRPEDRASLDDAEHAQAYRRHLMREHDGQSYRGP